MNRRLRFSFGGLRSAVVLCLSLVVAQSSLWADGVKRTIDGCTVKLECEFTGPVESDLVIEEQFTSGWSIDTASVRLTELDAFWSSNGVPTSIARFAVPPNLATNGYVITYTVTPGPAQGSVSGGWRMYHAGKLQKESVISVGSSVLSSSVDAVSSPRQDAEGTPRLQEMSVSITEFKVLSASRIKLSYVGLTKPGSLVVEGCENLGKPWNEVKREQVLEGNGSVELETNGCKFYRMKLETEE